MLSTPSSATWRNRFRKVRVQLLLMEELLDGISSSRFAGELLDFFEACLLIHCLLNLVAFHIGPDLLTDPCCLGSKCFQLGVGELKLLKSDIRVLLEEDLGEEQGRPLLLSPCWRNCRNSLHVQFICGHQVALDPGFMSTIQAQNLTPLVWDGRSPSPTAWSTLNTLHILGVLLERITV